LLQVNSGKGLMMNHLRSKICTGIAGLVIGASGALAASQSEINQAIADGLAYLSGTQTATGYWAYSGYEPAATGASAFAMLSQQSQWGTNTTAYQDNVDKAMSYLLTAASSVQKITVTTRSDGQPICPGGGSCNAVFWVGGGESTYTTGLIATAIGLYAQSKQGVVATNTGPLAGMTWGQIAQAIVNGWSASQSVWSVYTGGWRYGLGGGGSDADMSTTQWGVLSLTYMKALGATVPTIVNTDLAKFLAWTQNTATGAGCYQSASSGICDHADTGGLLLSLNYLGKGVGDPAVDKAIAFLKNNWTQNANNTWYGNFGHPYAMWADYKGLELTIGLDDTTTITTLKDADCTSIYGSPVTCNWWQDYNEYLVSTQNANGSWTGSGYWTGTLATAFYLPILGGTEIPDNNDTPEPSTVALVGLALAALARSRQRIMIR
jgi:hypothetical protein